MAVPRGWQQPRRVYPAARAIAIGVLASVAVLAGCSGPEPSVDASTADTQYACVTDEDCDDGVFCDGDERCRPDGAALDARGCAAAVEAACAADLDCVERTHLCVWRCPDDDADGSRRADCGGGDCDDADPQRFPGRYETCDARSVDEDCDPTTFGVRDQDGDGDPDALCCNGTGASAHCGTDCNDLDPHVNSTSSEICDDVDNDCDGAIDEEAVAVEWYRDLDADGFGDASDATLSCTPVPGRVLDASDCDDTDPHRRPSSTETCDRLDQDCDGRVDENVSTGVGAACSVPGASGACATGRVLCGPAGLTCAPLASATAESCNGNDDDCDGRLDEGIAAVGTVCAVPGAHGICAAGRFSCTGALVCVGPAAGPELCTPDNENCDALDGAYDGLECQAGASESCVACGTSVFSGQRACDSGCRWSSCAVGASSHRWNGADPAMSHGGGSASGTDWVIPCGTTSAAAHVFSIDVLLPPGHYQVFESTTRAEGPANGVYGYQVTDVATGALLSGGFGGGPIVFDVGPDCRVVRISDDIPHAYCYAAPGDAGYRLRWIELRR